MEGIRFSDKLNIIYREPSGFVGVDGKGRELFTVLSTDNGPDEPSEGLFRITKDGKIGFAGTDGIIAAEPVYDAALPFSGGMAAVCAGCEKVQAGEYTEITGGSWGFIDRQGDLVISCRYSRVIESFRGGAALVEENGSIRAIDTAGSGRDVRRKDYRKWAECLVKAARLITKLYFTETLTSRSIWKRSDEGPYRFADKDVRYLRLELQTQTGSLLAAWDIIPRTDFRPSLAENGDCPVPEQNGSIELLSAGLGTSLVTVTDYAVVFEDLLAGGDTAGRTGRDRDRFADLFYRLLDRQGNGQLQEEELTVPPGVREISHKVYRNYAELETALPGSSIPPEGEWRQVCSGRMLRLRLVPDRGPVTTRWLQTKTDPETLFFEHLYRERLADLFSEAMDRALASPEQREDMFRQYASGIEDILRENDAYDDRLFRRYEKRLKVWLSIDAPAPVFPSEENIFGGYEPKRTEDTAADYMPALRDEFAALPAVVPEQLQPLLDLFFHYKLEAEADPGKWEEGNVLLGAEPEEYRPSRAELMTSEIGERIRKIAEQAERVSDERRISYKYFTFTHVDVMGSGRFFYVVSMEDRSVDLQG